MKDEHERTALHWACAGGHSDVVRLLLAHQALESCLDASGLTALHYCVRSGSAPCLEHFLSLRELTHLPSNQGLTALMEAAAGGMGGLVRQLLQSRVVMRDVDHKDPQGMSSE